MPLIWIIEDEPVYQRQATTAATAACEKLRLDPPVLRQLGDKMLNLNNLPKELPDIIVLDVHLRNQLGGQVVGAIPRVALLDFPPFIVVWSHFVGDLKLQLTPRGRDRVIRVPFKSEELLEKALVGALKRWKEEGVSL